MEQTVTRKKLIEVALPLEAINAASAREKSIRHGHPSTLHLWWARRPLATARAVLFSQLVDDPSSRPELFPTEEGQSQERQRLFRIIEELVKWENTTNETVLEQAREEIRRSWRRTCEDNRDHPRAADLFDPDRLPAFHDPFAGGGSIPLEAQRLGLEAHASDLNPVAVLINKAMIEIPPRFAGRPPVNPEARRGRGSTEAQWKGAAGLAEDVRYYGKWMRDEAEKRIGHLYPKIEVTTEMAQERPDLKPYVGRKLTVIAWLWARTVKSPNPAFADVDVPLASTFMLSTKKGKEAYIEPVIEDGDYRFTVKVGTPPDEAKNGTKLARGANFQCVMSKLPIASDYIKSEGKAGRMSAKLMAIVAEGDRGRVYLAPTPEHESIVHGAEPTWMPDVAIPPDRRAMFTPLYGLTHFKHLFTDRQLVALTTFSDLVGEARERVRQDAVAASMPDDGTPLRDEGDGAQGYAEAVGVYLAFALSKQADLGNSLCRWEPIAQCPRHIFSADKLSRWFGTMLKAIPFGSRSGSWNVFIEANLRRSQGRLENLECERIRKLAPSGRWIANYFSRQNYFDGPTILRQHRLRRPVRLLLCLAAPIAGVGLPRPLRHTGSTQSRGTSRHTLSAWKQGRGGEVLPQRHDFSHAASRRTEPILGPPHHLLRLQAVGGNKRCRYFQHWMADVSRCGHRGGVRCDRDLADAHRKFNPNARSRVKRTRFQHSPRLPPSRSQRPHRHPPGVPGRPEVGVARGVAQDAAGQYSPGGPGPGRHRTGNGHLHPLRPGAGRERRGSVRPRGSRPHQRDTGRGACGAGGRLRRRHPLGAGLVRSVGFQRRGVRRGRDSLHGQEHQCRRDGGGWHSDLRRGQGAPARSC